MQGSSSIEISNRHYQLIILITLPVSASCLTARTQNPHLSLLSSSQYSQTQNSPSQAIQAALQLERSLIPHAHVGKAKVHPTRPFLIPHQRRSGDQGPVEHLNHAVPRVLDNHRIDAFKSLESEVADEVGDFVETGVSDRQYATNFLLHSHSRDNQLVILIPAIHLENQGRSQWYSR